MCKSYVYVGIYYDVLGRPVSITDKKIGKTINPNQRENSLNATKGPIRVMFIKLYEFDSEEISYRVENIFETLLRDRKVDGEWYRDDDGDILEMVSKVMNNLSRIGVNMKEIDLELDPNITRVEKVQIQRAKNSKLKLIHNGEDISDRFAVDTFVKVHTIIGEMVGWDNLVKDGKYDIFNSVNEFHNNYPSFKQDNNGYHEINGYFLLTWLSNRKKQQKINKLIEDFKIEDMFCTID